jgi:predicted RNA binding protein YcfA (HicA-like mRNA interferase family)
LSKIDKLKARLLTVPKDFSYSEVRKLLNSLGFVEYNKGKTSGSRVIFYRSSDGKKILLHKHHPSDIVKIGTLKNLINFLKELGEL